MFELRFNLSKGKSGMTDLLEQQAKYSHLLLELDSNKHIRNCRSNNSPQFL